MPRRLRKDMNFNCSNDGPFASFKRQHHSPPLFWQKKVLAFSFRILQETSRYSWRVLRLLTPPWHTRQDETAIWTFQFMMFMILLQHGKLLGVLQTWLNPAKECKNCTKVKCNQDLTVVFQWTQVPLQNFLRQVWRDLTSRLWTISHPCNSVLTHMKVIPWC